MPDPAGNDILGRYVQSEEQRKLEEQYGPEVLEARRAAITQPAPTGDPSIPGDTRTKEQAAADLKAMFSSREYQEKHGTLPPDHPGYDGKFSK